VHRLIRHLHERRARIRIRIDGNRLYAHAPRGLDDTAGDFTTIGDQDFLEHDGSFKPSPRHRPGFRARQR
jgi:hypothetical protein